MAQVTDEYVDGLIDRSAEMGDAVLTVANAPGLEEMLEHDSYHHERDDTGVHHFFIRVDGERYAHVAVMP